MRVLIGSPRKSGSAHLRCLLATAYGLDVAASRDAPDGEDVAAIDAWLAELPDACVTSAGYRHSPELARSATQHGVALIGILRHPCDLFLSNFEVAQQRAARKKNTPEDLAFWNQFAGRSLNDPEMVEYAANGFSEEVGWLLSWQLSGAATIHFEALAADPAAVLSGLMPALGTLAPEAIDKAVEQCPPEGLILSRPFRGRRMGDLPPGAWREHLPAGIVEVLRQRYAEDAARLGYRDL